MLKVMFLIVFLGVSTVSISQEKSESMSFRITGGVNFGYMKEVPPVTDALSSLGFMVGVNGNLGSNIFFQPGLQFASYGSSLTLPDNSTSLQTSKHEMRANYVRLPLQVGLRLFDPSTVLGIFPFNLEVRTGISGSYLVGYTDKVTSGSDAPIMKSDVEAFRTAWVIGAGVRLVFLSLGVEYEYGINKFFKNIDDSKLNVFYIIIGGYL